MKSFYSILKLSPNIATQDSVALGLILFDGQKFRYYISDNKLKLAKKLTDDQTLDLKFMVNQIIENLSNVNSDKEEEKLFYKFDSLSNSSFFDYLSKYSNGLIQFSKPNALFEKIDDNSFEKLVYFLFKESVTETFTEIVDFDVSKQIVRQKLISKVENKVHTEYKFRQKTFPSIYFSYEMDCVGLNGSLIGAKSLSFTKSLQVIDKDISHYFTLISSLSSQFNKSLKENKFYLISEEPKEVGSKEHKFWESVSYNDLISVIHPEESNEVADLIIEKNASKFLSELE